MEAIAAIAMHKAPKKTPIKAHDLKYKIKLYVFANTDSSFSEFLISSNGQWQSSRCDCTSSICLKQEIQATLKMLKLNDVENPVTITLTLPL